MGDASPLLFKALTTAQKLDNVTIEFPRTGPQVTKEVYYTVSLKDAVISGIQQFSDGPRFLEDVSFVFRVIEERTKGQKESIQLEAIPTA